MIGLIIKQLPLLLFVSCWIVLFPSCMTKGKDEARFKQDVTKESSSDSHNAVYFWKTVFQLSEEERRFIKEHAIDRIYLRLFDVDVSETIGSEYDGIVPVATTTFKDSIPKGVEIVPTFFITVGAIKEMIGLNLSSEQLSAKILRRILNMADYNDLGRIREIQLDCDWTAATQRGYFDLCKGLRSKAGKEGISVSSTIRLHQLKLDPPPVDRGVLMLYNTGSFKVPGKRNSILRYDDVKQYLKGRRIDYPIPLDFAYPAYCWGVWFQDGVFMSLLHHSDFSDESCFKDKDGDGIYSVIKDCVIDGHELESGDCIRLEKPSFETIQKVSRLVKKSFPETTHRNIIYHLDSTLLSIFTDDEIKDIYSF